MVIKNLSKVDWLPLGHFPQHLQMYQPKIDLNVLEITPKKPTKRGSNHMQCQRKIQPLLETHRWLKIAPWCGLDGSTRAWRRTSFMIELLPQAHTTAKILTITKTSYFVKFKGRKILEKRTQLRRFCSKIMVEWVPWRFVDARRIPVEQYLEKHMHVLGMLSTKGLIKFWDDIMKLTIELDQMGVTKTNLHLIQGATSILGPIIMTTMQLGSMHMKFDKNLLWINLSIISHHWKTQKKLVNVKGKLRYLKDMKRRLSEERCLSQLLLASISDSQIVSYIPVDGPGFFLWTRLCSPDWTDQPSFYNQFRL